MITSVPSLPAVLGLGNLGSSGRLGQVGQKKEMKCPSCPSCPGKLGSKKKYTLSLHGETGKDGMQELLAISTFSSFVLNKCACRSKTCVASPR